jgi:hypothetical protein
MPTSSGRQQGNLGADAKGEATRVLAENPAAAFVADDPAQPVRRHPACIRIELGHHLGAAGLCQGPLGNQLFALKLAIGELQAHPPCQVA